MLRQVLGGAGRLGYKVGTLGLTKGPHITRYSMYRHLHRHHQARPADHRVLSISHSEPLARLMGYTDAQITDGSYPNVNILNLPYENESFDAVVSDQVMEHVEGDPYQAVAESLRVLKPGGLMVHTTCFINPMHDLPGDYWRFTPQALKLLVGDKAQVIDADGWGNRFVWPFCMVGLRFVGIPHAKWHPAHWVATANDQLWLVVTWVVARKPIS